MVATVACAMKERTQAVARQSQGQCVFCQKVFSKGGIKRHLQACKVREDVLISNRAKPIRLFHLAVEGFYTPDYWLNLEAPDSLTLEDLDSFLRDTWLECCGHLSAFNIEEQVYTQLFDDGTFRDDKDMKISLERVFYPGLEMEYEYDFGSTTYLGIKVVEERIGPPLSHKIEIMARNEAPVYPCDICGQPAVEICVMCLGRGQGFMCKTHAEVHECGQEMFLPVVNSPRVGVCAYVGDAY